MQVRLLRFGLVRRNPLRRSCVSRARNACEIAFLPGRAQNCAARNAGAIAFWISHASLLEEVSYETLVLETWRFTFGGSLVRNARFGGSLDLALHLEEVSYETLVLETCRFTFARFGDLALHFWRKSRTKRWFWRLGASLGGSLVRNAGFGDLSLHFWRKSKPGSRSASRHL